MIKELENLPDISFIDNATLGSIEAQMKSDYEAKYKEVTGEDIILATADPVMLVMAACSVQFFQAFKYIDRAGKLNLLKYTYGDYLDDKAAGIGIVREPAKPARTIVRFTLSAERPNTVEIPQGTRLTDSEVYFETEAFASIAPGSMYADVECVCMTLGTEGNKIQAGEINTLVDPIPYVASVSNTEETTGGVDVEDDDTLKERVYLAPSGYSVAGPEDAYKFWVKTFNSSISDVYVDSEKPVEVSVEFIMQNGELPTESMIKGVQSFLQERNVRPLCDKVTVKAPDTVTYNLNAKYYIGSSDTNSAETIKKSVEAAVEQYIIWQRSKIGRDINPSQLIQMMMAAGAKRVDITLPVFQVVGKAGVAKLGTRNVTYGGIEDD